MAEGETPQARGVFFTTEGDGIYVAQPVARSPWNPGHQNGIAIGGLLTWLAERTPSPAPMLPAHIVIDILRPTPFAPIEGRASVVREGKRMQMVESVLVAEGEVVARARVLRVREAPSPTAGPHRAYPPLDACRANDAFIKSGSLLGDAVASYMVAGDASGPGPATIWAKFEADLMPGVPVGGVLQAAMLADFGNGLSNPMERGAWSFANVDISLHLTRRPVGEWMIVDAETIIDGLGVGLANMILADEIGPFGRAHQTLFIAPIEGAPPVFLTHETPLAVLGSR